MSKFVDERVVEMSFDNKRFESNVKTSIGTINELKNSLDFSGTANKINGQLNGVNTGGLSTAIMNAKMSFTAFEIATIAAIANITNRVIDLGIQMVKSLSIDNILSGWSSFESMAVSEFTLLAQGFEQSDVTGVLDKLSWYADETSYSFSAMVDVMSRFTAAGLGLEESSNAMIGISNWAAMSGANAQTAAHAMIQLSQGVQAGVMRLQDWRSIQTAQMDTDQFRQTVLDTAVAMGELIQNIDGTYTTLSGKTFDKTGFTTQLSEGWFSTDVFMKSLEKYSGATNDLYELLNNDDDINLATEAMDKYGDVLDEFGLNAFKAAQTARTFTDVINSIKDAVTSGWRNVFLNVFGNVEEAKILWSDLAGELYDVFMDGLWKKIEILDIWASLGGRDDLFANTEDNTGAFWNLFNAIVAIKDLIGGSWQKVFGFSDLEEYKDQVQDISTKLKTFTENLKEWSEGLIMSSETTEVLTNILTGLFSILKIVGKTVISVAKGFSPLIEVLKPALGYLLGALGLVGKEITNFSETTTIFEKITSNLQVFFTTIIEFVRSLELLKGVKTFIDSFSKSLNEVIGDTKKDVKKVNIFKSVIDALANAFHWLGNVLNTYVVPILPKLFDILGKGLGWIVGSIVKLVSKISEIVSGFKNWTRNNQTFQNGLIKLRSIMSSIANVFTYVGQKISEFFKSLGKNKTKPVDDFSEDVEKKFSPLKTFLSGLVSLLEGLWHFIKAISSVVGAFFAFIGKGLKFIGDKIKEIFTTSNGDVNFAKLFTYGFWAVVVVGIYRFADTLRSITQVFRDAFDGVFDYFNSKAMQQYMEAIKTMAISILLMVGALLILGSMDPKVLKKSMIALGTLVGFIVGVMILLKNVIRNDFKKVGKEITTSTVSLHGLGFAFMGLAIAILLLAATLKMVSKMDPKEMTYGLAIIGIMMIMLIGVMKVVEKSEKGVNKAVKSMVKVAISISLLAKPLKIIGSIDTNTGIRGLIGIAALMAILIGYSRFSRSIEKSQKPVYGLLSTAIALTLLIIPLKVIGAMDWIGLGKSAAAIAGLFIILTAASRLMRLQDTEKLRVLTRSLIKVAVGLAAFGFAMLIVSSVSMSSIRKALLAVFSILLIFVGINKILSKQLTKPRIENMRKMIWHLTVLSVGLASLGIAMRVVGSVNWLSIKKSLFVLSGVFLMFVAIIKISDKQLTKARVKNMSKMVWSLTTLGVGLTSFGIAMQVMANMSWDKIKKALGTIAIIFAMLSLFNLVLKVTGSGAWNMIAMAGALVILSGGLLIMSVALLALGSIPLKTIGIGLLAIVGVFAVLAIAAVLLQPLIPALLALSATFFIFGLGVFLLVTALSMLVGIVTISAAAFAAGLIAMAGAVLLAAPMIMEALWAIIEGVLKILTKAIPLIANLLITLFLELIRVISEITPALINLIVKIIFDVLDAIDAVAGKLVNAGFNIIISIITGFTTAIKERGPELRDSLYELFETVWQFISGFFTNEKLLPVAWNIITGLLKGLWDGFVWLVTGIGSWAGGILTKIGEFFSGAWDKGIELITNIGEGAKNAWDTVGSWFDDIAFSIVSFFVGIYIELRQAGENILKKIKEGAVSAWASVKNWFESTVKNIVGFFTGIMDDIKSKGKDIIDNLKKGAVDAWDSAVLWFNALPSTILSGIGSAWQSFKDVGENLIEGLVEGIIDAWYKIPDLLAEIGGAAVKFVKDILGIESPSTVFAEIGKFIDLGLVEGIDDNSDKVFKSIKNLGDDTSRGIEKSGLSRVLTDLNKSLESDFDNQIVITPVLDLSEIQNGKNRLFSMFNDIDGYNMSGSNRIANSTRDDINKTSKSVSKISNNDVSKGTPGSEIIYNTFNISGANPKEIAQEVSRVLQNQVDRRKQNGLVKV